MSRLLRMYSRGFRERYGDEIRELLAASERPVIDRIAFMLHAVIERGETTMRRPVVLGAVAAVLAAVSLVAFGYALAGLADGVREVPQHWWSTLPLVGLGVAGTLGVLARSAAVRRSRRARS